MDRYGGPEVLRLREVVDPTTGPDELLVQVGACGVCGHDLLARAGRLRTPLPAVLGHEISGVVVDAGAEVTGFAPGDRVALVQRDPCGLCASCTCGAPNRCREGRGFYGEDQPGGYATHVVASERNTVRLPPEVALGAGAALSCALGTGWHALRRVAAAAGEVVVITGAGGGVGVHAIQLGRHLGMHVVAVTAAAYKHDRLLELGAHHVVTLADGGPSLRDQLRDLTGGLADVVLELAGAPTFEQSVAALAPGGRLALVGNVDPQDLALAAGLVILKELSVLGSSHGTKQDLQAVMELVATGRVTPVIAEELPLEQAARAHEARDTGPLGRRVLIPDH